MRISSSDIVAPARGIMVVLAGMIAAVVALFTIVPAPLYAGVLLITTFSGGGIIIIIIGRFGRFAIGYFSVRHGWGHADLMRVVMRLYIGAVLGLVAGMYQLHHHPPSQLAAPLATTITGDILRIDGRADYRTRLWIRAMSDDAARVGGGGHPEGRATVRVTFRGHYPTMLPGDRITAAVRLFPPSGPLLPGGADFGRQARMRDVVASGYVRGGNMEFEPRDTHMAVPHEIALARYRAGLATTIGVHGDGVAGGIAAALLVGDRRFVSDQTYAAFRDSGLAHLLAISGLHMGLICFGVIAVARAVFALAPRIAVHMSAHKVACVMGIIVGCGYVLISGAAISAVRAFIMAALVICAVLLDRFAISLRNVALAALVILLGNPVALFTAGFQLSFAATAVLVMWFEARSRQVITPSAEYGYQADGASPHQPPVPARIYWRGRWFWRFCGTVWRLAVMSVLAAMATMPFAAHHFGTVTPWGVLANIVAIPLTGLWIMPAGMAVLGTAILAPDYINVPTAIMRQGIEVLVYLAHMMADLPAAGMRVKPPSAGVLLVMVGGALMIMLRPGGWHRLAGAGVISIALASWAATPQPVGVVLAREAGAGQLPVLVLATDGTIANVYATAPWQERLSEFTAQFASLPLGQTVHSWREVEQLTTANHIKPPSGSDIPLPKQPKRRNGFVLQSLPDGGIAAIVRRRAGLTAACKAKAAVIFSFEVAFYPCADGTPIIIIPGGQVNRLLYRDTGQLHDDRAQDDRAHYGGVQAEWRFSPQVTATKQ